MFMCAVFLLDVDEWRDDAAMPAGLPGRARLEITRNGNAGDATCPQGRPRSNYCGMVVSSVYQRNINKTVPVLKSIGFLKL